MWWTGSTGRSLPAGHGLVPFIVLLFCLGFAMSLGKAAVYKHIPVYYPGTIGSVGGLVGMVGGLGGFVLPIAFGALNDLTGVWTSCFMLLFVLVASALTWMHFAIRRMERAGAPQLGELPELPEMASLHADLQPRPAPVRPPALARRPSKRSALMASRKPARHVLTDWRPEDPAFWSGSGKTIASRNLWISIPNLLLAFSVWMVWSMVVAKLKLVGFRFTTEQLFWLTALPALSGATLRIFYTFMVPILGGRLWTTLTTLSLLIPAIGIGLAVQDPTTPYEVFVVLALLCGLGGGNFASSMANIGFFFPKNQKGNALASTPGFGNLGVSVMQFLVPVVIGVGMFLPLVGAPQTVVEKGVSSTDLAAERRLRLGPLHLIAGSLAWLGMNDIASARASFAEQSVVFKRKHNWVMCWLYIGTFGSFIGFSAAFPLLAKTLFPDVQACSSPSSARWSARPRGRSPAGCPTNGAASNVTHWVFMALWRSACSR
jgi:NNP family nitrate/nitrite transporter-like MFS transporter